MSTECTVAAMGARGCPLDDRNMPIVPVHPKHRLCAAVVGAVMLVTLASCGDDDDEARAATTSTEADAPSTTAAVATTAAAESGGLLRLEVLGGPDWLAADDRYVYVKRDDGYVDQIDPDTNEVVASVEVGGELCQGMGVGFDAVWTCRNTDVARVDFETGRVETTIPLGKASVQGTLPAGFDRIWVLLGDGGQLTGIDPTTNVADPPIELGVRGTDVAVADDGVWVASSPDGAVVRVDPATRAVTARFDGLDRPSALAVGDDVWAGGASTTVRIDPTSGTVIDTIEIGVGLDGALALDGTSLWIRNAADFLQHVDTETGAVEMISADAPSGGDVLVAFGSVWASAYNDAALFRLPLP